MSKRNQLTTPPGIVIKAEKRVPYSVINITDINAYRQERHAKRTERHLEFLRAADADKLMRERNEFIRSEHDRKHGSLSQRFSNLVTKLMKSGFGW